MFTRKIPALRFLLTEDGPAGGGAIDDKGFPADTPVADMTPEQTAAYWKHYARKHESAASTARAELEKRGDYDEVRQELEQLRTASQTETERALNEAREEARREGEVLGSERYLKDAVRYAVIANAPHLKADDKKSELDGLLSVIDAKALVGENGELDLGKITAAISALAPVPPAGDDVFTRRNKTPGEQGPGAGSVAAIQEQYAAKYASKP